MKRLLFLTICALSVFVSCNDDDSFDFGVKPSGDFTFEVDEENSVLVTFSPVNVDTSNALVAWDFGFAEDDTDRSAVFSPEVQYPAAGTFTARMILTNDAGITTVDKSVTVTSPNAPSPDFCVEGVETLAATFVNNTVNGDSYEWDFGDGSDISAEENPFHEYAEPGIYEVTLTAFSVGRLELSQLTRNILIVEAPEALAGTSPEGKAWRYPAAGGLNFGDGFNTGNTSCELDNRYIFFPDGAYQVNNNGTEIQFPNCTTADPEPLSTWTLEREAEGGITIIVGADTYLGDPTQGPDYQLTMLTRDTLKFERDWGFTFAKYRMISAPDVTPPTANFSLDTDVDALALRFVLESEPGVTYTWDFGNGQTWEVSSLTSTFEFSHAYNEPGVYTVSLTATNAAGSDEMTISDIPVLAGDAKDLAGEMGDKTWRYDPGGGISFDEGNSFCCGLEPCEQDNRFVFSADGTYQVENNGTEIQFPNCVSAGPEPASTWTLTRNAGGTVVLTIGNNTYLGDPTTSGDYLVEELSANMLILQAEGFGKYKMIPED